MGDMIACGHCGALAPAASRFCPACGEAFDDQSHGVGDSDAESRTVAERPEATGIEESTAVAVHLAPVPRSADEAIFKGRYIWLYVNAALLCIFVGLTISNIVIPPVRADTVAATPSATATFFATDTPVESTPTRSASPTPTTVAARAVPTAAPPAPMPSPTATATAVPTATVDVPPTPVRPTPIPTSTP